MEPVLLILLCLLVAVAAEYYLARHRCQRPSRLPEDIQ